MYGMAHNLGGVQWVARARSVPASGHTMCSLDKHCVQGGKCHYHPRPGIMSVLSVSSVSSTQTKSGEIHFSQAQAVTLGAGGIMSGYYGWEAGEGSVPGH